MIRTLSTIRPVLRFVVLAIAIAAPVAHAAGQAASPPPSAAEETRRARATGDTWLDARLVDIDDYARRYPDAFAAELERYAGVPRAYVLGLLAQPGWSGGDAWFACFLARVTEATCRSVVRARTRAGQDADWRDVAAGFDARPGSDAWTALRLALADSYRRWAHPLQPDAALTRALRQREQQEADKP